MRDTSGMSATAQQAVSNINNDNTPYQRDRAFKRKALRAGITGGVGLIGGLVSARESYDKQNDQKARDKKASVDAAIKNAKRPPSHPDDTPRDEYGLEVARPNYAGAMDRAVLGSDEVAKTTLAQMGANDAATAAPIAGRWTARGFQDADMNASVNASDIERAKAMMRFGGLQNSFNGGN